MTVSQKGKKEGGSLAVVTMGCRFNQLESELILQDGDRHGFSVAEGGGDRWQEADVVVVNTCSVTGESDRQARQLIRRIIRKRPAARIVATGCYAQREPEALAAIPGVDLVAGNAEKERIAQWLSEERGGERAVVSVGDPSAGGLDGQFMGAGGAGGFSGESRAFIQVQNGCDEACTYCIIPEVRGASRSIPPEQVVKQAEKLIWAGFRELVLTGINLGSWGKEKGGGERLADLVERLLDLPGLGRLRLSSLDPLEVEPPLVALFRNREKLCPHLHLSIQSGDDMVLKRMRRHYRAADVVETADRLREARPDVVFGTDLIVGFPTETDEAFDNTLALVRRAGVSLVHAFRYSDRPGAPAAEIPRRFRVPDPEIRRRSEILRDLGTERLAETARGRIGGVEEVLVETVADGVARGKSGGFMPVRFPCSDPDLTGELAAVCFTGFDPESGLLIGGEYTQKRP